MPDTPAPRIPESPAREHLLTVSTYRVGPDGSRSPKVRTVTAREGDNLAPLLSNAWPPCQCRPGCPA